RPGKEADHVDPSSGRAEGFQGDGGDRRADPHVGCLRAGDPGNVDLVVEGRRSGPAGTRPLLGGCGGPVDRSAHPYWLPTQVRVRARRRNHEHPPPERKPDPRRLPDQVRGRSRGEHKGTATAARPLSDVVQPLAEASSPPGSERSLPTDTPTIDWPPFPS